MRDRSHRCSLARIVRTLPFVAGIALAAAAVPVKAGASSYVGIWVDGSCLDSGQIFVQWSVQIDDTTQAANWYGFDIYRSDMAICGPWLRVTTSPIPRTVGAAVARYSYVDSPPDHYAWHYQVRFVTATGTDIQPAQFCECNRDFYVACPWMTTPIGEGSLISITGAFPGEDVGLRPCPGSCYPAVGLGPPLPANLEPLVDSGGIVRLFGTISCGIEGCVLDASRDDSGECGAVPVRDVSWGRVKTIYR